MVFILEHRQRFGSISFCISLKRFQTSTRQPDGFGRVWNCRVLKQFSSIYMLHTRFGGVWNCRVLKHQKIKEPLFCKEAKLHGTQTRAATDPLVLEKKKLHGTQTGFFWCADEFPAWKGELHGTQTHRNIQETTNLVWKKIKLHGTKTHATLWWKITEPSNSVTRSYGALEKGKIAWFSNDVQYRS